MQQQELQVHLGIQELIKQNKQQQKEINDLQDKVKVLEEKDNIKYVTDLEARLAKLESLFQENIMNRYFS